LGAIAPTFSHGLCSKHRVHKKTLLVLLSLAILFDFSGCVSMSAQARRERAYRHYVSKQMKKRQKEMARAQKAANRDLKRKMKNLQPSEPQVTTSVGGVSYDSSSTYEPVTAPPASISDPATAPQPPPAFKEPTINPITVSASDAISASQNPDQPSPP